MNRVFVSAGKICRGFSDKWGCYEGQGQEQQRIWRQLLSPNLLSWSNIFTKDYKREFSY